MNITNKNCTKKSSVDFRRGLLQSIAIAVLSAIFIFSQFSDLNLSFVDESLESGLTVISTNENSKEDKSSNVPDLPIEDSQTPEDNESPEETEYEVNLKDYLSKPYLLNYKRICSIDSCKENLLQTCLEQSFQNRSQLSLVVILHSWKIHYS
jgi:hypothetical protein